MKGIQQIDLMKFVYTYLKHVSSSHAYNIIHVYITYIFSPPNLYLVLYFANYNTKPQAISLPTI